MYVDDELVGLTSIYIEPPQPGEGSGTGHLVQDYVRADYRGRGLSRLFYEGRIDWARQQGLSVLMVGFRKDNHGSAAAAARAGFKPSYSESQTWPDGATVDCCWSRLELFDQDHSP